MFTNSLAPIVLFVYNRPWHTLQTLESLAKNNLAKDSILFIYADGAKENADDTAIEKIKETRNIIRQKLWCKEVHIIEADNNKGLADSIVGGVTEIINKFGKIIVLEDDIVTSPGFLQYMNDSLTLYENEEKVMHVSGYTQNLKEAAKLPETYFIRISSCWGWATWKRSWDKFILDAEYLKKEIEKNNNIEKFNLDNTNNWFSQIEKNVNGTLQTWAIKWYGTIFLYNGLCLYPRYSLVNNIGFDGSGTHCDNNSSYDTATNNNINVVITKIEENEIAKQYLKNFYVSENKKQSRQPFFVRLKDKIKRMWN